MSTPLVVNARDTPADHHPEFWDQRPELKTIRDWARQRLASPWAVFGAALARAITTVPPSVTLPAIIGGQASLNLFVGVVGMSGQGKGIAEDVAAEALNLGARGGDIHTAPLGSGEGMVSQYAHTEKGEGGTPVLVFDRAAVLFSADEIDSLNAQSARTGATLSAQLRTAWMGKLLGFAYRDLTKRVTLPAHSYRLCLVTGIQPGRAGGLLAQAEGGLPQRFLWLPADDPDAVLPETDDTPPPVRLDDQHWPAHRINLPVPPEAIEEIRQRRQRELRGAQAVGEVDGHTMLCRLKVAAGLALLAGRRAVLAEDWELSGTVMAVSAATYRRMVDHLAAVGAALDEKRGRSAGISADAAEAAQEARKIPRVAKALNAKLGADWTAKNDLYKMLAGRDRQWFEPAVDHLIGSGAIETTKNAGGGISYRQKR